VLELRGDDAARFDRARTALAGAIEIGPRQPVPADPVLERIA
jgi:hypothetical protein